MRLAGQTAALGLLLVGCAACSSVVSGGRGLWRLRGLFGGDVEAAMGDAVELVSDEPAINGVSCFIDSYQAVLRFANAAVSASDLEHSCQDISTDNGKAKCSAQVNTFIYNTIFVIGATSQAISDCKGSAVAPAVCTATVTGFLANLDVIAGAASSLTQTCNLWWEGQPPPKFGVTTTRPRPTLPPKPTFPPPPKPQLPFPTLVPEEFYQDDKAQVAYQKSMVKCWIATSQGVMFLMRAGLIIRDMTNSCDQVSVAEESYSGRRLRPRHVQTRGPYKCAVDVIGLLGVFALAARFISLSVPACLGVAYLDGDARAASCAADAEGVFAGLFAALAPGMQLKKACSKKVDADSLEENRDLPDGRRLLEGLSPEAGGLMQKYFTRDELDQIGNFSISKGAP